MATPVPLRPLTTGEVLDAAVDLLKSRAGLLLGLGALAALLEQVALYPLRVSAGLQTGYGDGFSFPTSAFSVLLLAGLATEALAIALLSDVAATRALPIAARGRRPFSVGVGGMITVLATTLSGVLFLVPVEDFDPYVRPAFLVLAVIVTAPFWALTHALVGGITAAVVLDNVNAPRGVARSMVLAGRSGLRVGFIRVLGYVAWLLVRLACSYALAAALQLTQVPVSGLVALGLVSLLVNTLAYPVLACLNVVLHIDARVRTEGLDIALSRARDGRAPLAEVF